MCFYSHQLHNMELPHELLSPPPRKGTKQRMTTIFSHLELETTTPVFPYLLLRVLLWPITKLSSNETKTHLQSDNLHFSNLKSQSLPLEQKSKWWNKPWTVPYCWTTHRFWKTNECLILDAAIQQFNLYTCPDDRRYEERAESLQRASSQMRTFPWSMPLTGISPAITEEPGAVTGKAP